MTTRVPAAIENMTPETVASLQELVRALKDSAQYHKEAADGIRDDHVSNTFLSIAAERNQICDKISSYITLADEEPAEVGTFAGGLRTIWTAFRAGINSGDPTIVLTEAERAEDVILEKFKSILPNIAGNPINDELLEYFERIKNGHDRVLALRNAYQAK